MFNYAQALTDKGLVQVMPCLDKKGSVRIMYGQSCSQMATCNCDIEMIDDPNGFVCDFEIVLPLNNDSYND